MLPPQLDSVDRLELSPDGRWLLTSHSGSGSARDDAIAAWWIKGGRCDLRSACLPHTYIFLPCLLFASHHENGYEPSALVFDALHTKPNPNPCLLVWPLISLCRRRWGTVCCWLPRPLFPIDITIDPPVVHTQNYVSVVRSLTTSVTSDCLYRAPTI